jgi:hypothetical protein
VIRVLGWAFAVGGIFVAVAAALNLLGLAGGRLLKNPLGRIENLGFLMMGAGVAGFLWPPGSEGDAPPEPWRFYLFGVMGAGFVLPIGPEVWRSYRRRARAEADALFFLHSPDWAADRCVVRSQRSSPTHAQAAYSANGWLGDVRLPGITGRTACPRTRPGSRLR